MEGSVFQHVKECETSLQLQYLKAYFITLNSVCAAALHYAAMHVFYDFMLIRVDLH